MPNETLQQTLASVAKETQTPSTLASGETPQASSPSQASETQSGGTPQPEYVSGIDISDVPEQDRPRIREALSKKAGLLEKGYQQKYSEIAKFKKAQDELVNSGLSVDEAQQVLSRHLESKKNPQATTQAQQQTGRTLDKLLDMSPAEQKDALRQLDTIIKEQSADSPVVIELKKELAEMKKALSAVQGRDFVTAKSKAESDLEGLKTKFGNELIDRHRDLIMGEWSKYPQTQIKDIVKYVVPDEEYEQAILSSRKPSQTTKEKINAISSAGSGISSVQDAYNPKMKTKDLLREVVGQFRK